MLFSCWQTPIRDLMARPSRPISRPKTLKPPRRERREGVDHPDRRGFARPVGTEDPEAFARIDRK